MVNTKKNKQSKAEGADGVQTPHAIFPKPLPATLHGLYLDLLGFQLDRRTRIGQAVTKLTMALLERFPDPAPAMAQAIAQRCAVKLIRAASYEAFVLKGGKPAPNADRDYLSLTGSIRADIQTLWTMSKDGNPKDPVPSLEEYLKSKQVVPIEAERGEDL